MKQLYYATPVKDHLAYPHLEGIRGHELIMDEDRFFSQEEIEQIDKAITSLGKVVANVYRINGVNETADEFLKSLKALNSDNVEAFLTTERRLRTYVMECDMFLDYWHAYTKRVDKEKDPGHSEYNQLFDDLTRAAYDGHVEYQLTDLLRNHTAHVQSPVNRIQVSREGNEAFSNRDVLLTHFNNGPNKKRILMNQPAEIALSPIVETTAICMNEIHDALMYYQINEEVESDCKVMGRFINYMMSIEKLFDPWVIMDTKEQSYRHINDIKAYGYLLNLIRKRQEETRA